MIERKVNITNFIGVYDNYILPSMCKEAIDLFERENKFKRTLNRIDSENTNPLLKQDQQYTLGSVNLDIWWEELKPIILNFDVAAKHYFENTGITQAYGQQEEGLYFKHIKIQKTLPTEGYHIWHVEHGRGFDVEPRAIAYSIYLNDVKEGGETEFLHFSKRVQPKTGRIVIWPAGFPYVHRGNPPLSGEKYILTSWMTLR